MSSRRCLLFVSLLVVALDVLGIAKSILPAQDGLKFIKVARRFQTQPWGDVVRGSDQHPLYPALIAMTQPPVALFFGQGPNSWRVAAQLVSALAYLALLWPLHRLSTNLFDSNVANLTLFLFVLLPLPAELGRDTLGDAVGLLCFITAICFAEAALRCGRLRDWIGSGIAIGLGYLARPEIALIAVSIALFVSVRLGWDRLRQPRTTFSRNLPLVRGLGSLSLATLVLIGGYALVKGEVSEKLALRSNAALAASSKARPSHSAVHPLPSWLSERDLDLSPKEETGRSTLQGKASSVLGRFAHEWVEGLGWIFAPFAVWGFIRCHRWQGSTLGRGLVFTQAALYTLVVLRHASTLGYLSGRHAMSLVLLSLPFAGAAIWHWAAGVPARRGLSPRMGKSLACLGLSGLFVVGIGSQTKGMHPSRWGHLQAGEWLIENAKPDEAVLDTRGWTAFLRGEPSYDYWHVRQALTDQHLRYIVVESDELEAGSKRAATLRMLLDRTGDRVAAFPDREGKDSASRVLIFRFTPPPVRKDLRS